MEERSVREALQMMTVLEGTWEPGQVAGMQGMQGMQQGGAAAPEAPRHVHDREYVETYRRCLVNQGVAIMTNKMPYNADSAKVWPKNGVWVQRLFKAMGIADRFCLRSWAGEDGIQIRSLWNGARARHRLMLVCVMLAFKYDGMSAPATGVGAIRDETNNCYLLGFLYAQDRDWVWQQKELKRFEMHVLATIGWRLGGADVRSFLDVHLRSGLFLERDVLSGLSDAQRGISDETLDVWVTSLCLYVLQCSDLPLHYKNSVVAAAMLQVLRAMCDLREVWPSELAQRLLPAAACPMCSAAGDGACRVTCGCRMLAGGEGERAQQAVDDCAHELAWMVLNRMLQAGVSSEEATALLCRLQAFCVWPARAIWDGIEVADVREHFRAETHA